MAPRQIAVMCTLGYAAASLRRSVSSPVTITPPPASTAAATACASAMSDEFARAAVRTPPTSRANARSVSRTRMPVSRLRQASTTWLWPWPRYNSARMTAGVTTSRRSRRAASSAARTSRNRGPRWRARLERASASRTSTRLNPTDPCTCGPGFRQRGRWSIRTRRASAQVNGACADE